MDRQTLRFASPVIRLRVLAASQPHSEVLDDWRFSEYFSEKAGKGGEGVFGAYQVSMEHTVKEDEDAGSAFISGEYHSHALEKAWLYGTGTTMGGRGYDFMLPPAKLPHSWTSNAEEVLSESDWSLLRDGASYTSSQRTAPTLPLKGCLDAVKALAQADDVTVQLTTYHFGAVTALDSDLHFLLFAQGLEMARELLPGSSSKDKESHLPLGVRSRLRRGLNWLFGMSNQRRQTRHAIDKHTSVSLKENLSDEDEQDYLEGAHAVLQHVVSSRLQLPTMLFEDDSTVVVA